MITSKDLRYSLWNLEDESTDNYEVLIEIDGEKRYLAKIEWDDAKQLIILSDRQKI